MPRSFLVGFGIVIATVLGVAFATTIPREEAAPPHVRLPDRGSTLAQAPGSSLEGLEVPVNAINYAAAIYVAQVREQVRLAEERLAQIAETAPDPQPEPTPEAVSASSETDGEWTWDDTARCETGGDWSMQGSMYSGGLGFLNATWDAYGGQDFASNAGLATREQQIIVAERIQSEPGGCSGW